MATVAERISDGAVLALIKQWLKISVPFPLRFLFTAQPAIMSQVLGIV